MLNDDTVMINCCHTESYVELHMNLSKRFVLCLMDFYNIN